MKEPIGSTGEIKKALQTIKFKLDEKGGEVKSDPSHDVEQRVIIVVINICCIYIQHIRVHSYWPVNRHT